MTDQHEKVLREFAIRLRHNQASFEYYDALTALLDERECDHADAERYRYLKNHCANIIPMKSAQFDRQIDHDIDEVRRDLRGES